MVVFGSFTQICKYIKLV